jgi:DNA-binding response OmpR family regulator
VKDASLTRASVVDDGPMLSRAGEACLQRQGMEVTIADSGRSQTREFAAGNHGLMLADSFIPHMRGLESIELGAECCLHEPFTSKGCWLPSTTVPESRW